jgi:hypothetical protein
MHKCGSVRHWPLATSWRPGRRRGAYEGLLDEILYRGSAVKWIRSPAWDLCWIWSGIPAGLLLAVIAWFFWQPGIGFRSSGVERPMYWFFALVVMLETGHVISPIMLVWFHRELRTLAWRRRKKFVWIALGVFGGAFSIGTVTTLGWTSFTPGRHQIFHVTSWTNPLPVLVWIYLAWNAYHFGMQNYGIIAIYKRLNGITVRRWVDMSVAIGLTALFMNLAFVSDGVAVGFAILGLLSINHWLVSIGLCGMVSRRQWLFTGIVLGSGAVGFAWLIITPNGNLMVAIPVVVGIRLGMSFVHFLYDRWIWKFSDPEVRATIGRVLLA